MKNLAFARERGILGRVCPRAANPSAPTGKLYSSHMGGTLASHPRTSKADPFTKVQFFVTAPYFFPCTKNNTNSLSSSCIDYRFACKLCVRNRINLEPKERVGVSETGVHPWATVYLVTGKFSADTCDPEVPELAEGITNESR